jgi:23S rRNA (pseudouridine1915-N3)-methyltransferase
MTVKLLWPGKMKSAEAAGLQSHYLQRISALNPVRIVETPIVRGLDEKHAAKILELEAVGLEKHLNNDYIVCLFDRGQDMNSIDLARFFERRAAESTRAVSFVVGGFLGLAPRLLERADLRLSLSRMTFSHELCRLMLLEQIYRAFSLMKGRSYAK